MVRGKSINGLLNPYMSALDRADATQRERRRQEVAAIQQRHAGDVATARRLQAELATLDEQHGPTLQVLAARQWGSLPQHPAVVNQVATIERLVAEAMQILTSTQQDLERLISGLEHLTPERLRAFNGDSVRWQVRNAANAPAAIRQAMPRIQHAVEVLAQRCTDAEVEGESTLAPLPPEPSFGPQVELA